MWKVYLEQNYLDSMLVLPAHAVQGISSTLFHHFFARVYKWCFTSIRLDNINLPPESKDMDSVVNCPF